MCDGAKPGTARGTVLIENARTRVTEWRFAARGDNTGWHRHEYDYVITPLTRGEVELVHGEGQSSRFLMEPGVSYFRAAGVEHDVVYRGEDELRFVEVELKSRPG